MPSLNLTDLALQRLAANVRTDFWDKQLPSFGVRVGPLSKVFLVKVRNRRITLGRYPNLTLKDARRRAHVLLGSYVEHGTTPFVEARTDYLERHCKRNNKPSTAAENRRLLNRFPFTGDLNAVTKRRIMEVIRDFPPAEANHAFKAMRTFLNWAVENDYLVHTPLHKVRLPNRQVPRTRLLTDDEVRIIWTETHKHDVYGPIIRSLILSGQRLSQMSSFNAAWAKGETIVFPGFIMKSNREHTIPLTPTLQENLPDLATPFVNHTRAMRAFRKDLPPMPHWQLHDIRRYFSSTCASLGVPIDITEAILDHRSGSRSEIQRIYDRYDRLPQMRSALETYEAHILSVIK